jgi:septum formation protein
LTITAPQRGTFAGDAEAEIVLASGSAIRARLLTAAGIAHRVVKPSVDEDEIKAALRGEDAPVEAAVEALAELKAKRVSARNPRALVIGADQILECDGEWFDKPGDRAAAAETLRRLSGKEHHLIAGVCVARHDHRLWHHVERARLVVRPLSEAFIARYLDAVGDAALKSVGAYQLEGLGAHLFAQVDGDFFTILGLPLLPLLAFLREHGALPA